MAEVRLGNRGYRVALVQKWLTLKGLLNKWNGEFDSETKEAVIELQNRLAQEPTGVFDFTLVQTYEALVGNSRAVPEESFSDPDYSFGDPQAIIAEMGRIADQDVALNNIEEHPVGVDFSPESSTSFSQSSPVPKLTGDASMTVKLVRYSNPGIYVEFQGIPEELSDNNQANYTQISTKGRSAPFQDYENSGPRQLSFTYDIDANYCHNHNIKAVVEDLRSFCYPEKSGNIRPPKAMFYAGAGSTFITCVVNSVGVTWKKPIINHFYSRAAVTITVTEVVDESELYDDIAKGSQSWLPDFSASGTSESLSGSAADSPLNRYAGKEPIQPVQSMVNGEVVGGGTPPSSESGQTGQRIGGFDSSEAISRISSGSLREGSLGPGQSGRLDQVAFEEMGTPLIWWAIATASGVKDPLAVNAGEMVCIPDDTALLEIRGVVNGVTASIVS